MASPTKTGRRGSAADTVPFAGTGDEASGTSPFARGRTGVGEDGSRSHEPGADRRPLEGGWLPPEFEQRIGRGYFLIASVTCAGGALLAAFSATPMTQPVRMGLGVAMALAALLCAALAARPPAVRLVDAVTAVSALGCALAIGIALGVGQGIHATTLGFLPSALMVVAVVAGLRRAIPMAAVLGLALLGLVWAEAQAWIGGAELVAQASLASRTVTLAFVIGFAAAAGLVIAGLVRHSVAVAARRATRLRSLLDMAVDWYWETDAQHRFIQITEGREGASGIAADRRLGLTPWELPGMAMSEQARQQHQADHEAQRPFHDLGFERIDSLGQVRSMRVSGEPRLDAEGRFLGYWGVGRDVTAEVQAQQRLASSEARYRELFARSPTAIVLEREGRVIDANAAAARLFGVDQVEELIGASWMDPWVAAADRPRIHDRLQALSADAPTEQRLADPQAPGHPLPAVRNEDHDTDKGRAGLEIRIEPRERAPRVADLTALRVDTPSGPATMLMMFDVTAREQAQQALRRSEALLSSMIAGSPDAIALTDPITGVFLMVSDQFCQLLGWPRHEVIGQTSVALNLWANVAEQQALIEDAQRSGHADERMVTLLGKHGRTVQLKVSGSTFELDGRRYLLTHSRDVTAQERSRMEREAILANASVGIAFTRQDRFELTNRRFEHMFAAAPDELLGRTWRALTVDEQAHDCLVRQTHEQLEGRAQRGQEAPVIRSAPIDAFEQELRLCGLDGQAVWCRLMARSIDPSAPQAGTIWIAEDVSAQRDAQAALARARDDAQAASRAKSAFLANTSHELRTPLNGLLGLARLALEPGTGEQRREQYLRQIHDSAQSLAAIISDILDLSRIEAGKLVIEHRVFDLHAVADSVRQLNQPVAEARGLVLGLSLAADVPRHVVGDALRVRQILANYVANAMKFTERGRVDITLRARPGPLPSAAKPGAGGSSVVVRLEVKDTGVGIARAQRERLFSPFSQADESTTRRFGGTGLGLSICRELAMAMRGDVGVESEPGLGSCFWAELPLTVAAPRAAAALSHGASDHLIPPGRRVLVVEDHPVNMLVATTLLRQWGLEVMEATDGQQALDAVARAEQAERPFDLVVMDVQMPVMGGHEAAQALRRREASAQLPIVALTAAALVTEREAALAAGMNDFVTKPVDPAQLRAAVSRQLMASAAGLGPPEVRGESG